MKNQPEGAWSELPYNLGGAAPGGKPGLERIDPLLVGGFDDSEAERSEISGSLGIAVTSEEYRASRSEGGLAVAAETLLPNDVLSAMASVDKYGVEGTELEFSDLAEPGATSSGGGSSVVRARGRPGLGFVVE